VNLLGAKLYDPAVAVSKATSSLLAMTAVDTTNLRAAITVPAHGMIRVKLRCAIIGATTFPTILLGVLNGATVVGRVTPIMFPGTANAATQAVIAEADFVVTGLTPGAMNLDAAYGVEVIVAATNIKYGGPNNTTTTDAFGAFVFEVWDPQPQTANTILGVDANGRVDVSKVAGTAQTARDLGAQLDATVSSRSTYAGGAVASVTAAVTVGTNNDKTGYALSAAGIQAIWDALTSVLTTVGSIGKRIADNLDAAISSRSTYAGADTTGTTTLLSRLTGTRATNLDNLSGDAFVRLGAPAGASVSADIAATKALLPTALAADGSMKASISAILGTAFTEGAAGRIATAFKAFFNIATPTLTTAGVDQTGDGYGIVNGANGNAAIKSQTAAIEADTQDLQNRTPAALVGGRMSSDVGSVGSATALGSKYGNLSILEALKVLVSGAAGVSAGAGTSTALLKTPDGTSTLLTFSVDVAGNVTGATFSAIP
jgi:hypothetical protein